MTTAELNRDIKRLYKSYQKAQKDKSMTSEEYFLYSETVLKKEFIRLYYADTRLEYINKLSILIMMRINQMKRWIPFHTFYIGAKIDL